METSSDRFIRSVLDLQPRIAVFDCDGTLWQGDAGDQFLFWAIENKLIADDKSSWAMDRFRAYQAGEVGEHAMWGDMVALFAGLRASKLERDARTCFSEVMAQGIFPEMQALTRQLADSGCELWAVSSTNEWVIRAGVSHFRIPGDHVLAASVEIKDGIATDRVLQVPTDEGKAIAIEKFIRSRPDVVCGNSIHDVAMLQLARHPLAVNPTSELEPIARQRSWPIFRPAATIPS